MSSNPPPRASDPGPHYALAAPSAESTPLFFPSPRQDFPSIDDRLAEPETPEEYIRGERCFTMGAHPPHADQHFRLDYVLAAHVHDGYVGATDLLTRASEDSDFASDTCIRKGGTNPATGTRWLEEIAFEIINEQSQSKATVKAEDLTRRGVRRVFGIFVKKGEVKEWSGQTNTWQPLSTRSIIQDDRCLRTPIPVKALLHAAEADLAVVMGVLAKNNPQIDNRLASMLVEKGNPVIAAREASIKADGLNEGRKEGLTQGEARGLVMGILSNLSVRGVPVSDDVRSRIQACADLPTLRLWLVRTLQVGSAEEVVAD